MKKKSSLTLKKLSILAISFMVILSNNFSEAFSKEPYTVINADELLKMKNENKSLAIIDSRGGDWFDGTLIEGAVQLSVSDTNEENLTKIVKNKSDKIVFYCTNEKCPASTKAAHKAAEMGYSNIYKYKAGIEDWKKRNLPVIKLAKK
jgi:rhodanese-related sulfurtransferase